MPEVRPFRGVRYATTDELVELVCPPYDVISPADQVRLYERNPHNVVRLELPRGDDDERYADAHATFNEWLVSGILVAEERESLYVYRQDFIAPDGSRAHVIGVIGALALEPFGQGVLPHERTMPGPKKDRLALLRALPVNVSPIYSIYRGGGGLAPFFDSLENRPPEARFKDGAGTLHRLWVANAPAELSMLSEALAAQPLVIADGHHRYETALEYHKDNPAAAAIMCFCVDVDAADLVVLPYHRAAKASLERGDIKAGLESQLSGRPIDLSVWQKELEASDSDHPFTFVVGDDAILAEIGDDPVVAAVGERHPAWRALDVVALHEVVLPALVPGGIEELTFSRNQKEIVRLVREDGWTFGVLLRALTAPQVVDVARSGERMPQKASYFWPKAITGLVLRPVDEATS